MNEEKEIEKEIKKIEKEMNQFAVIGLGRFGRVVATNLIELGNEVLVIDSDPEQVKKMEGLASAAVVADATSTDVLYSLGVTPTHFLNTVEKYNGSVKPESSATFLTESIPCSKRDTAYLILKLRRCSEYPIPIFSLKRCEMYFAL